MPSEAILAMQYMPAVQKLYIAFHSRIIYCYSDVPIEEWREFLAADSKGTYLNQVFKLRNHPFETVEPPILPPPETDETLEWGEIWSLRKKAVQSIEVKKPHRKFKA